MPPSARRGSVGVRGAVGAPEDGCYRRSSLKDGARAGTMVVWFDRSFSTRSALVLLDRVSVSEPRSR